MTLKEFSKDFNKEVETINSRIDTISHLRQFDVARISRIENMAIEQSIKASAPLVSEKPKWQKVHPLELRYEERTISERWFRPDLTKMFLQEKWERTHKGDVIDTKWRDVAAEYIPNYE